MSARTPHELFSACGSAHEGTVGRSIHGRGLSRKDLRSRLAVHKEHHQVRQGQRQPPQYEDQPAEHGGYSSGQESPSSAHSTGRVRRRAHLLYRQASGRPGDPLVVQVRIRLGAGWSGPGPIPRGHWELTGQQALLQDPPYS